MRLLKEYPENIVSYYELLTGADADEKKSLWKSGQSLRNNDSKVPDKYSFFMQVFVEFENDAELLSDSISLLELLKSSIKKLVPLKDSAYFCFDEKFTALQPQKLIPSSEMVKEVNVLLKEGILQTVFDSRKATIIPQFSSYRASGSSLNYLLYPLYEQGKKSGMYAILTPASASVIEKFERDFLGIIISSGIAKVVNYLLKEKLNAVYTDLQTYQAKLSNDFRLAAVGEMTEGILEDIGTPLQAILGFVELAEIENGESQELKKIRNQVKKIQQVISRLVKFNDLNQKSVAISPCSLNTVLVEYNNLVKSTLNNMGIELVLDLEKSIPPILTHPNYLYQILANLFAIIRAYSSAKGGIIIQSRDEKENVLIRVITTVDLTDLRNDITHKGMALNKKIIDNLMKKHEGEWLIDAAGKSGSSISFLFPIRRKIRQ